LKISFCWNDSQLSKILWMKNNGFLYYYIIIIIIMEEGLLNK
jgi:hypothetical protein